MTESLLRALAEAPPILVYGLIGLSCFVETFLPPAPSDVFVLMAGFLTHQGTYDPTAIFLTAWIGGIAGAIVVHWVAAHYADRFVTSRIGRIVLPPEALAFLLKEYGRYGMAGLFLTRLLPGFRSVVAPFAGLNRIALWRLMLPVTVATGLWYAALTWVGTKAGDQWDVVVSIVDRIYSTLGIASAVLLAALIVGFLLWRRKRKSG